MTARAERAAELRAEFERVRGYWSPLWDSVLAVDPAYFEAYLRFSEVPWRDGPIEPRVKELLYIAVDAVTTHLYEPGIRIHVRNAMGYGATVEQIVEVIELCSLVSLETGPFGADLLLEEMAALGLDAGPDVPADLPADYEQRYGGWSPKAAALARLAPDYVRTVLGLADAASSLGALDEVTVQLVLLAANASVTHSNPERARLHIRRALELGATPAMIVEVLQLASVLGVHSLVIALPIMEEEVAARGSDR